MIKVQAPQRGFTLIELLVSVAVSIVVITMLAGVFTTSRVNHDVQDDIAQMQENIRTSSALLRRVIYHAGHRAVPQSTALSLGMTQFGLQGTEGTGTAANQQDTLTVSFEGSGKPGVPSGVITDCLGNPHGVGTSADVANAPTSGYPLSNNRFAVRDFSGRPWLACSLDGGGVWFPLVPDVEAMEITYGEDTDGDTMVDRYVNAANGADFSRVVTVRLNLLFRTNRPIASSNTNQTYTLDNQVYGPFNDLRVRRQIIISAGVRNAKA